MQKQAERAAELDAQFPKLLANYFKLEEYTATRQKLLLHENQKSPPEDEEAEPELQPESETVPSDDDLDDDDEWGSTPKT